MSDVGTRGTRPPAGEYPKPENFETPKPHPQHDELAAEVRGACTAAYTTHQHQPRFAGGRTTAGGGRSAPPWLWLHTQVRRRSFFI
jgi:hypothetical protein